ncbi:MAG: prefoldin subunit beta [Candidatus Aenigmarchaeota archaeon]|nr:prefoldin subunit beta [Candidatus Aenigmarchaeota archaeon]
MVTAEDRDVINQFQVLQQQLQEILIQKENVKLQKLEFEKALEELNKTGSKEAYKIAGPIMIKRNSDEIKKEMQEKLDDIEIRLKTLNSTEDKITNKLKEIEPKIKKMIGQ